MGSFGWIWSWCTVTLNSSQYNTSEPLQVSVYMHHGTWQPVAKSNIMVPAVLHKGPWRTRDRRSCEWISVCSCLSTNYISNKLKTQDLTMDLKIQQPNESMSGRGLVSVVIMRSYEAGICVNTVPVTVSPIRGVQKQPSGARLHQHCCTVTVTQLTDSENICPTHTLTPAPLHPMRKQILRI